MLIVSSFSLTVFGQVALNVNKPLSETDKQEVSKILRSFDSNSYKLDIATKTGNLNMGNAKGLASVGQKNTTRVTGNGAVMSTNTKNNIFKQGKMSTNTQNNVFKVMSTNTKNNIFKEGRFNDEQLSQMDKLYTILSKYQ